MNKKYLILVGIAFVIIAGFVVFNSKKEGKFLLPSDLGETKKDTISESKATLISQENNVFKINLKFKKDDSVGKYAMRYYIFLYKADDAGNDIGFAPINKAIYDDKILFRNGDSGVEKNIIYTAPQYLQGKYNLIVNYTDEFGDFISSRNRAMKLGTFDLNSASRDFVEIFPERCYLSVEGEATDKKYDIAQGVDIKSNEKLIANCSIRNNFNKDIRVIPNVRNFKRGDFYGDTSIPQEDLKPEPINFAPGETKELKLSIPKALQIQAYDAELTFLQEDGTLVSNKTSFHYVLAGESAGVMDVSLDKNEYASGDIANVNLAYFGSSDVFPDSRLSGTLKKKAFLEIDIKSDVGKSCLYGSKSVEIDFAKGEPASFSLKVVNNCNNPFVNVIIKSEDGHILENKEFLHIK
ncbi:MAG: hypothetical protein UR66_C0016G0023 [Candidatus Moranbacteria bacterium GW2011_GWE1_35_17]|nr:MAG: hypothetical protein UR66_C0016G0023 [Candidatus Moranbacteria bacterium GW2011_GWE1_35_17]KKP82481.1 MAG: hypothetical protein UR82_C0038G0007 [Candidatus Moranbacteria bacterium GW2011_GWF1_35_5]